MAKNKTTYDVFIAYDNRDSATAMSVAEMLRAHNLTVFYDLQRIPAGANLEDTVWEAMAESHALVVVVPREVTSSWLAFELGAAKAWNKPIYAVSNYVTHQNLPGTLRLLSILPITLVDEIAFSIKNSTDPMTGEDLKHLGDAYVAVGFSVDQLLLQPQQLAKLVKHFNRKCGRKMAGEQIMGHLLRLRKQGRLPILPKHKATKR